MQIVGREGMFAIGMSTLLFVIGLFGGYTMTTYDPLTVIIAFSILAAIAFTIAWFTIVKPAQYIKNSLFVDKHLVEGMVKLRWVIANVSEEYVKIYKYRIRTINDKGITSFWQDHYYDVFLDPKGKLGDKHSEDEFEFVPPSTYKIQENAKNKVAVALYYSAGDGKDGFVISETEVDMREAK